MSRTKGGGGKIAAIAQLGAKIYEGMDDPWAAIWGIKEGDNEGTNDTIFNLSISRDSININKITFLPSKLTQEEAFNSI